MGLEVSEPKKVCSCYIDANKALLENNEEFEEMLSIMTNRKTIAAYTELIENAYNDGRISRPAVSLNAAIFECMD